MSALAKGAYFWRSAASGMRHAPFVHFIAVLTLAIALFTAGLTRGAMRWVDALLSTLGGEVELTVYLTEEATQEGAAELATALSQHAGAQARVVPPEEALARLRLQLGELSSVLDDLPHNPLPWTVEVKVAPQRRSPEALRELAQSARQVPVVSAVDYGEAAVERLSTIARTLRLAGLVAFLVVALVTVVIVSATLQLAIYARRAEIEIQKLVGATDRFVRMPFLIEGLFQGLFGAALALAGLWAFDMAGERYVVGSLSFLVGSTPIAWVDGRMALELILAGCGLGLGGSLVAVKRFLRV
ncbi:MAG: cell division protein FtsX [Myxococcota bacterium]